MRVLHFYKTSLLDSIGGVEVFMHTLCNSTANLGVDNTILSLSSRPSSGHIDMAKYKIVQAKQNFVIAATGFSFAAFSKFRELANDADIIHYHFPNPFADILHFTCKVNKPCLVTYHSDIIKQKYLIKLYKPLMYKFLKSVDKIVATSPNYFATSDILTNRKDKVAVIPMGLDRASLPALDQGRLNYWRQRLPEKFFLFIGAFRYYKGLHIALKAIQNTQFSLVLAGIGDIEYELKQHAKREQLSNVHFLGIISEADKIALLHLSYAFIFPSNLRSEAFGISLVEAALLGKPLITCEIGTGTSFVNIDQETGLVIEPSSPIELRNAMQTLLDNPDKATVYGMNAERRAKQLFNAENQAEKYLSLYKQLLSSKAS